MAICKERGCVSLAGASGVCPVHAKGYAKHDGTRELTCANCRRDIVKGEWYQRVGEAFTHAGKVCKAHPEVLKERARAEAQQQQAAS